MRKQISFAIASYLAASAVVPAQAVEFAPDLMSAPYIAEARPVSEIGDLDENPAAMLARDHLINNAYDPGGAALAADFDDPIMLPDLAAAAGRDEKLVAPSTDGTSDLIILDNILSLDIPEPSTWTMLVAGLGFMGVGLRRSRRTAIQFS